MTRGCCAPGCKDDVTFSYRLGTSYDAMGNQHPLMALSFCRKHVEAKEWEPVCHVCYGPEAARVRIMSFIGPIPMCAEHADCVTSFDPRARVHTS